MDIKIKFVPTFKGLRRFAIANLQSKKQVVALFMLSAVMAVASPILISLYLAKLESLHQQRQSVERLASDIVRRADKTRAQYLAAFHLLETKSDADPCSDSKLRLMSGIAVASEQLQAVGYISGDRLLCTSYGRYDPGLLLGPPNAGSNAEIAVRKEALPFSAGTSLIIVTHRSSGYTAIIHPDILLDVYVEQPRTAVGLISVDGSETRMISTRGFFSPRWRAKLGDGQQASFVDGDYVVAMRRSEVGHYIAAAAIPLIDAASSLRRLIIVLVPAGVVAGILLGVAVLNIARLQLALPAVIKAALKREEFFLLYQPVVDLQSGEWVGAEALLRWRRPNGEMVRPDLFIPVAEDSGLIQKVTGRVIEIAGQDAAGLFRRYPGFHISINLSSADIESPQTFELLRRLAGQTGAGTGNLVIEATERGLIKGEKVKKLLHNIRASGIKVSIDDFGTGYSSLSYLQNLEVDFLKIDKSFVDTIGTDAATSQVVSHIIEMAKSLKLDLIAEGVENEAQRAFLRDRGVQYAQGWLFAKPMPLADVVSHLSRAVA